MNITDPQWSSWKDLNSRPQRPKRRALPAALHPDTVFLMTIGHCSFSLPGMVVPHGSKTGNGIVLKVRMTLSYYIGLCQQRQANPGRKVGLCGEGKLKSRGSKKKTASRGGTLRPDRQLAVCMDWG